MGCNCKKIEKVGKKNPNLLKHTYSKKGLGKFWYLMQINGEKYLGIIFSIVLFIILLPFLALVTLYNGIVHEEMYVKLPFLNKKIRTEENG